MSCPKCSAPVPEWAAECPSCGIIFERWRKREERLRRARENPPAAAPSEVVPGEPKLEPSPPLAVNPRTARLVAGGVVLAWLVVFAWFMGRHPGRRRPSALPAPGQTVYVRDEETGDMKSLKVEIPEPPPQAPRAKAAPARKNVEVREASWVEEGAGKKP